MEKEGVHYKSAAELVCNWPKDRIDALAEQWAEKYLVPGGDILELTQSFGGRVHYKNVFGDNVDVNTIFVHGMSDFDIVLPDHTTPRRDRFTIAHELGHYILHSSAGKTPLKAARSGSDRAEWEANWFAGGFLMPRTAFVNAYNQKKENGALLSWLAAKFDVSEHAARVRCQVLGLNV